MKFLLDRDNELSCIDDIKIPDDEKIFQGWVYHPNPDHRGIKIAETNQNGQLL